MEIEKQYITEKELSTMVGLALSTLRNDRHFNRGFPYRKIGRSVRYNLQEIINFIEARKIKTNDLK